MLKKNIFIVTSHGHIHRYKGNNVETRLARLLNKTLKHRHHSTLTHAAGTSFHSTSPSNEPTFTWSDYQQSLTSSRALQLRSFLWLAAAVAL